MCTEAFSSHAHQRALPAQAAATGYHELKRCTSIVWDGSRPWTLRSTVGLTRGSKSDRILIVMGVGSYDMHVGRGLTTARVHVSGKELSWIEPA
jgi:hypothetical protein